LREWHPFGPVRSMSCSSQSRAAWSRCRPRTRCSSSALAPPQDQENCHAGGNAFVLFDGLEPMTLCNLGLQKNNEVFIFFWRGVPFACLFGVLSLEFVKLFPWGRVSAPAGVAPEALEEWEHSSKGYEHRVCTVDRVARPFSVRFSRPRHYFSRHRHSAGNATRIPSRPIQTAL